MPTLPTPAGPTILRRRSFATPDHGTGAGRPPHPGGVMSATVASAGIPSRDSTRVLTPDEVRRVIFASSLGTVFEWYDFYLYGSLAAVISKQFFSGVNPTAGFIFALLAVAAGVAGRSLCALFFWPLGG